MLPLIHQPKSADAACKPNGTAALCRSETIYGKTSQIDMGPWDEYDANQRSRRASLLIFVAAILAAIIVIVRIQYINNGIYNDNEDVEISIDFDDRFIGLAASLSIDEGFYKQAFEQNENAEFISARFRNEFGSLRFDTLLDILRYLELTEKYGFQSRVLRYALTPESPMRVCDDIESACWSGTFNITADNADRLSKFFDAYYLNQANFEFRRGMLYDSFMRLRRLKSYIGYIDTPLSSEGYLGSTATAPFNEYIIITAFLSDSNLWHNGRYVSWVFGGESTDDWNVNDQDPRLSEFYVREYVESLRNLEIGNKYLAEECHAEARPRFESVMNSRSNNIIRQIAAYLVVRTEYSYFVYSREGQSSTTSDDRNPLDGRMLSDQCRSYESLEQNRLIEVMKSVTYRGLASDVAEIKLLMGLEYHNAEVG